MMFALLLLGCEPEKIQYDPPDEVVGVDFDQDGYSEEDDCDDLNNQINPEADEICDGLDNNCSGDVDEGVTLIFYPDFEFFKT